MTDQTPVPDAPYPPQTSSPAPAPVPNPVNPVPLEVGPSLADLAKSVRRHRIWLIALTVLMMLPVLLSCFSLLAIPMALDGFVGEMSIDDEQLERARDEVEEAYGDRIKELDVRVVTTRYDDMPFSFLSGAMNEESLYIECELEDSGVLVADVISVVFGIEDLSGSGIIPTKGNLASRMSDEQLDAVLEAYAAETDAPLGSVRRYTDPGQMYDESSPAPDEVRIGKTAYPSQELWKISEGLVVKGDTVDGNSDELFTRQGHVFHEDPETGEFTYLGTEPAEIW